MPPRRTPAAPVVAAITPLLDEQVKDRVVYKVIAQFSTPKGIAVCLRTELCGSAHKTPRPTWCGQRRGWLAVGVLRLMG
jgi:hypothetical protein